MTRKTQLFGRFERLWHWSQAALILGLLLTGFEVHGSYTLLGFEAAASVHAYLALGLIVLWVFAIFWHATTGEWRQYIPTATKLRAVVDFYLRGIFRGEKHPFRATRGHKHNPLQLLAYLAFNVLISPAIWVSGALYALGSFGLLEVPIPLVAAVHVAAAWAIAVFFVAHVYMITTGDTVLEHFKAMVTGCAEVEEDTEAE